MIKLLHEGRYRLIETKEGIRFLDLDGLQFAWKQNNEIANVYAKRHKPNGSDCFLASSHYRMYKVKDETKLSGSIHLELHAGDYMWQGYLLGADLLRSKNISSKITSTDEIITKAWV